MKVIYTRNEPKQQAGRFPPGRCRESGWFGPRDAGLEGMIFPGSFSLPVDSGGRENYFSTSFGRGPSPGRGGGATIWIGPVVRV